MNIVTDAKFSFFESFKKDDSVMPQDLQDMGFPWGDCPCHQVGTLAWTHRHNTCSVGLQSTPRITCKAKKLATESSHRHTELTLFPKVTTETCGCFSLAEICFTGDWTTSKSNDIVTMLFTSRDWALVRFWLPSSSTCTISATFSLRGEIDGCDSNCQPRIPGILGRGIVRCKSP